MLEQLQNSKGFAFDVETTSKSGKKQDNLHFKKNKVITISFANDETQIAMTTAQIFEEFDTFKFLMTNPKYKKVGHNAKFDAKCVYSSFNIQVNNIWMDTYVASKLINETGKHGLKALAKKYLRLEWGEYDENYTEEEMLEYNKMDSIATWELAKKFASLLKIQGLWNRELKEGLYQIEMDVYNKFLCAEINGVPIDKEFLTLLNKRYTDKVKKLYDIINYKICCTRLQNINSILSAEEWLYYLYSIGKSVNEPFESLGGVNLNSPKQLSQVLFKDFGFRVVKTSAKSGQPSSDIETLTTLSREGNRFIDWLLAYRKWEMLRRHIQKLLDETIDGNIYPTFNTVGTDTGRFTCENPNLQQIPSKGAISLKIRGAFRPVDRTKKMVVADYSNVELRLLAHFTKDKNLLSVYSEGGSQDLHKDVEDRLNVPRKHAKAINFGISYGMGPNKLAFSLDIPYDEAKRYIEEWNKTYPRVDIWKKETIKFCKKFGFTQSIAGRRRHIDLSDKGIEKDALDLSKKMSMGLLKAKMYIRSKREREAINFVIQGSSADITKYAISLLDDENILMQVHDEIVIYEPKRTEQEIGKIMQSVGFRFKTAVPLTVDSKLVNTWREGK